MSLSFLTPSRTVLMIADDALFVYSISAKGVKLVEAVPWDVENFMNDVAVIISKECSGNPVLILNDMVEQHYRKERLPNVSALDKQNVLKRKLHVAFPNYPVRAALPLKRKKVKGAKSNPANKGDVYVFAAVPASEPFSKTMDAARLSLANIAGFCLLPIESADMITKLTDKIARKGENKPKWTVFMGQHQSGGLRQVVIKEGELALTRMTPVSNHNNDPIAWAKDVNQEFRATMSYLSRFGYSPDEGLNVVAITPQAAGDILDELIDVQCEFNSFTVPQVADMLGLAIGPQDNEYFADILHVAWIGRKSRFILPMKAKQIDNVSKPRQIAMAASVLLFLGAAFQGYQLLDLYQSLTEANDEIESSSNQHEQLKLQYTREVDRKKDMGFDIQLIQSSLTVYDMLEAQQINLLAFINKVGRGLGRNLRIDSIKLERLIQPTEQEKRRRGIVRPIYVSSLQMTFPSSTNAEKGNREVVALRERLQRLMPDHVVTVTKMLEDYEYSEELVMRSGGTQADVKAQDYIAELRIEGPPLR